MEYGKTELSPDDEKAYCLEADEQARVIKASGTRHFHYNRLRTIAVRESALLQGFPVDYKFNKGNLEDKFWQIENAIPVQLATAVARSVREVLGLVWEKEH
jgi:site-specific DNA-cytosine methylase